MACKYYINNKVLNEQEIKEYISSNYIKESDIKLTTLGDIADILAYSNSKLILDGYTVEYTTPDNEKFKTYQEASNHISELAKSVEDVDLSDVKLGGNQEVPENLKWEFENQGKTYKELIENKKWKISDGTGATQIVANQLYNGSKGGFYWNGENYFHDDYDGKKTIIPFKEFLNVFSKIKQFGANKDKLYQDKVVELSEYDQEKINPFKEFINKNKEYEQSKEIIEEWKKVNNIQYNPEEIYSRGQEFSSVVGAYSSFDVNLMMQNLLSHIEDNEKAGGKFAISAYTKPIDKQIGHLEGGGGKIKFKIYPQSNDILWAANTDVYSGSVWDASEKVNKDKKSELLGVSYTKYPSLQNVNSVQPNLAAIVDDLAHHHNELGISLTGNNFRLEYDENIPYTTKKIIDGINSILNQKYGKLVKPEIKKTNVENKYVIYSPNINGAKPIYFNTLEEAEKSYEIRKKNQPNITRPKLIELKGIQPTQTNETLKESIESVRNRTIRVTNNEYRLTNKDNKWQVIKPGIGNTDTYAEFDNIEDAKKLAKELNSNLPKEKEYISQALINTKIARLKEVAKKYPRSLIRSEVILSKENKYQVFERNEVLFQKIRFKQIKQEKNLKNDNVQGSYDFSDIFHYPFDEVYDELDQSEPTGEFEDTFDSEFETNSKKLDKIILNRYLKIQKSLERQKDKLVSEFNKIENTNDFTKDAEIYFDKHKELISEINIVEEKLKRIKAVVDAIFDKKDITSVVIAESNLIIDDINKLLKSENISPAELDYYYNLTKLLEEIHDENLKQEDSSLFTNASSEDLNQLKKLKNTFSNLNNDLLELLRKNINIKNDPIKDAKLFSQWFLKVGDYTNDILKKAESMISKSLFNITKFLNKELEAIKELHLKADSDFKRTGKQNNKFDIFFDKNKRIVQVFNYEYTDAAAKLYNAFRFASKDSAKSKRLELIRFHKQHSILLNAKYLFPDIYEHLTGTKVSAEEINKNIALYKSYLDDYTFEKMKSKVYKQTIKYLSKRDNDFFMSNMPFDENSLIQEFLTYIPKDKSNYNDKYSKIVQNDNLRNVYDKFMDLFNELKLISQGTTRSNLNKGFLPFLEKTMIENLSDFSFSTELGKFKQSILSSYDQLKNNSGQTVSNQVENPLKTVNDGLRSFLETKANDYYKQEKINLIYFLAHKKLTTNSAKLITEKFGPGFPSKKAEEIIESWTKEYFTSLEDTQTNDIQVLMNLMAQTVTSYKQKQAIESNLNLIKIAFDNQAVGEFDILGNLVGTNPTKKGRETKLAELLEVTINHFFGKNVQKPQLNDFLKRINNVSVAKQEELNKLVKEINENKELTPNEKIELEKALQNKFKQDSKYVDLDKINDKLLQYLRVLFLGWSPKSAFFNAAMGHIGNYMETIDGRIVDSKDLSAGVKMLFGKEKKKIQKLIANLSLIEDITKDFKKTTEESLHNEKWKNFKPERLQQIVEKSNQSPLIAALLNKSFNGVRIIDMIDESGNFLPQYEEYEYKFVNTAKYLIEKVHGPYDSNRIIMAETTSLGKNVIFMKKWMITSFFMKRFGSFDEKPREDLLMDYQFKGTYITLADVFNTMSNDQSGQRNYLLGIMKTMKAIALSDQSLTEVDKANLRSVRADLLIIGALLIAQQLVKYMLSDDDDDHEGLVFLLNTFFRIETELGSHYFLIDTFEGLAKNTIPQLDVYNRLEKIIKSFDENARISPAIRLAQMVPALNSGVSLYNFFNQQILYNR